MHEGSRCVWALWAKNTEAWETCLSKQTAYNGENVFKCQSSRNISLFVLHNLCHVNSQALIAQPASVLFISLLAQLHLTHFFFPSSPPLLSSTHKTRISYTNTPPPRPRSSFLFFSSLTSSPFLSAAPEAVVCLLTSWSWASAGLRLAPIIRAWQGAAVSTCQPNKHPLWHRLGVCRGERANRRTIDYMEGTECLHFPPVYYAPDRLQLFCHAQPSLWNSYYWSPSIQWLWR